MLLRYLSQAYKTLLQNVPAEYRNEDMEDIIALLRATLVRVDSSLVSDWERMLAGGSLIEARLAVPVEPEAQTEPVAYDISADPRAFAARVRAELHAVVRAIARGQLDEAIGALADDPEDRWSTERLEQTLEPVLAEEGELHFGPAARAPALTRLLAAGERRWSVEHTLVGPQGPSPWRLQGEIDLREADAADGPLVRLRAITG